MNCTVRYQQYNVVQRLQIVAFAALLSSLNAPTAAYTTAWPASSVANVSGGHEAIFLVGEKILRNDGKLRAADWAQKYLPDMLYGSSVADHALDVGGIPLAAANHYMDGLGRGLLWTPGFWGLGIFPYWGFVPTPAGDLANSALRRAIAAWAVKDYHTAAQYLGIVCHLIQDASVPHHATLDPLNKHSEYESWCNDYMEDELTDATTGGYYSRDWWYTPWSRVRDMAATAANYKDYVDGWNPAWWCPWVVKDDRKKAANALIPRAQRATAGMIDQFLWTVNY